ncbi:MAG: streptomycin biosynthesis protein StrI [Gemmatales bacterium]|nr:MAG: streptomycin biosynthesis protein StrI [Gemmatales bacterium]
MTKFTRRGLTRREVIKESGKVAAASTLAGVALPQVHAAENNTIQLALVGCGGRGTGAAGDALSTRFGPTKLVAMADVFQDKLDSSYRRLSKSFGDKVDVPKSRQFISFEGYKQAMDCLKPGDVVILTTPPAFRWVHYAYAIEKGLNVFMEKPVSVDGPSTRRLLALNKEAKKKNLKVGVGLMCRHCVARKELYQRIADGAIGDIILLRAYRLVGPTGSAFVTANNTKMSELMYQIRNFHAFLWASGGAVSDFLIHNIDECCWMKDAFPIRAKASGGRHYRKNYVDQNFDTYSIEYTFPDGTKMDVHGRCMIGCHGEFASYAHGTKGAAVISTSAHSPARCRIYKGHNFDKDNLIWKYPHRNEPSPYRLEWDDLIQAIREDKTYNEVDRGAEASLVTAMGRMAAHTGRIVTRDQMLNHEHELGVGVDKLTFESPAPLQAVNGKYPVPQPGIITNREF